MNYEKLEKELRKQGYTEKEIEEEVKEFERDEMENAIKEHNKLLEENSITCPVCGKMAMPWLDTNVPEEVQPMIYGHQCENCGWTE